MKLNLGAGTHPLDGFENLDPTYDDPWRFEDGLWRFTDASVEAITVSHALMMVPYDRWPFVFSEFSRVLEHGGVVRITEDATDDPASSRFGGFRDAVTLTSMATVVNHLSDAGLAPVPVLPDESHYKDNTLCQRWHGDPPKVFFIEGLKR